MHAPSAVADALYLVGSAVLFIIVVIAIRSALERKRSRELAAAAIQLGLNFQDSDTALSPGARSPGPDENDSRPLRTASFGIALSTNATSRWPDKGDSPILQTALFQRGHGKKCRNMMTGSFSGMQVSVFDYKYIIGSGKNSRTFKQTVAAFTPGGAWPTEFQVAPSGIFHKIGDAMVHKDVKFDSHPDFSSRYMLRGPDSDKIRELFTPALLSYLESLDSGKKWHIEGSAGTLVIYRSSKRVAPENLRGFLEETSGIAGSFLAMSGAKKSAVN